MRSDPCLVARLQHGAAMHLDQYGGARLPFACIEAKGIRQRMVPLDGPHAGEMIDVLDASGAYASACLGAGHPVVLESVGAALISAGYVTDEVGSLERVQLLEALLGPNGFLSPPFGGEAYHVAGRNSGSEGIELALRLALESRFDRRSLTIREAMKARDAILVFEGAWHGWTAGALSLLNRRHFTIGLPAWGRGDRDADVRILHLPFADAEILAGFLAAHGHELLAVLVEPIQGDAGIIVPPRGYLRALAEGCRRHGVLLVADEVLTFAKTGQWLAMADEDGPIETDITVLGKSLGMGVVSTSLVVARRELSVRSSGAVSTSDLRPLTSAVIRRGMMYIDQHQLLERSRLLGKDLRSRLRADVCQAFPRVFSDVRGLGFLNGLALTESASRHVPALRRCILEHGVYVEVMAGAGHRSRHQPFLLPAIRVAPPLIATEEELVAIVAGIRSGTEAFVAGVESS